MLPLVMLLALGFVVFEVAKKPPTDPSKQLLANVRALIALSKKVGSVYPRYWVISVSQPGMQVTHSNSFETEGEAAEWGEANLGTGFIVIDTEKFK